MKAAESSRPPAASSDPTSRAPIRPTSAKVHDGHLGKLAIVYVRQSSPQQVLENRESTRWLIPEKNQRAGARPSPPAV